MRTDVRKLVKRKHGPEPLSWIALVLALSSTAPAAGAPKRAVWTPLGPEVPGNVVLVVDPGNPAVLHAGTRHGVFNSNDGGTTWSASALSEAVALLAIDPQEPRTLYAATRAGLFKSTDAGATWLRSDAGLPEPPRNVVIDPQTPSTVYATAGRPGTYGSYQNLYKSTDGGTTWHDSSHGITEFTTVRYLDVLTIDPEQPAILYVSARTCFLGHRGYCFSSDAGMFKTVDGGASWEPNPENVTSLAVAPGNPTTLYGVADGRIRVSTDGGASWSPSSFPDDEGVFSLTVDPGRPSVIYAGTREREFDQPHLSAYRSADGGATWVPLGLRAKGSLSIVVAGPRAPSTLYAASVWGEEGLFKSTDDGATWTALNAGLLDVEIAGVGVVPGTPDALYAASPDLGLLASTDRGRTWTRQFPNGPLLAVVPVSPTGLWAIADYGIYWIDGDPKTTTFEYVCPPTSSCSLRSAVSSPARPDVVLVGACNGLAESQVVRMERQKGVSVTRLASTPEGPCTAPLVMDPRQPSTAYAGTTGGHVFRTVDGGVKWAVTKGRLPAPVTSLAMDRRKRAVLYAGTAGRGVFKSRDRGRTWRPTSFTDVHVAALAVDPRRHSRIWAGTQDAGVFLSTNAGRRWRAINSGLTNLAVRSLAIGSGRGGGTYLGTRAGAFELSSPVDRQRARKTASSR